MADTAAVTTPAPAPAEGQGAEAATAPASTPTYIRGQGTPPPVEVAKKRLAEGRSIYDDEGAEADEGQVLDFPAAEEPEAAETEEAAVADAAPLDPQVANYLQALGHAVQQIGQRQEGMMAVDVELAREDAARREAEARAAEMPDPETDPEGHMRWTIREEMRQELAATEKTRDDKEAQVEQQRAVQAAHAAITDDLNDAAAEWSELQPASEAYVQHGLGYYVSLGHSPQEAQQFIRQAMMSTMWRAYQNSLSPAEAIYNLVGAEAYAPAEEEQGAEAEAAAPAAAPAGRPTSDQMYADRRAAAAPPAPAGVVVPTTQGQNLRDLADRVYQGDEEAQEQLLEHAKSLGDFSKRSTRLKLLQQLQAGGP